MTRHYLKIAFRVLSRQRLTTSINILGLALGIGSACLAYVVIDNELSYDRFHHESENIYWLSAAVSNRINLASTPAPLAPSLAEDFPEVTDYLRLEEQEVLIKNGREYFKENVHFSDEHFFSFFDFPMLAGSIENVLKDPRGIVISEGMAQKYFGTKDPIGAELEVEHDGRKDVFFVNAVAENPPANSSIQFDAVFSYHYLLQNDTSGRRNSWKDFPATSFIRLSQQSDIQILRQAMPEFTERNLSSLGEVSDIHFNIRALVNYHLRDRYSANGLTAPSDMRYLKILGFIAFIILAVACLNFITLSNAASSSRFTEVGVRKTMGAIRSQLKVQFWTQSILISFIAMLLGLFFLRLCWPYLETFTGFTPNLQGWTLKVVLAFFSITLFTGVLAGAYPAYLMSRYDPVRSFKSDLKAGGNNMVTRLGLVFQFTLSIGLVACTMIILQQQHFLKNRNLGISEEHMMVISTQLERNQSDRSAQVVDQMKQRLLQEPAVQQVAAVSNSFTKGNSAFFLETDEGTHDAVFFYDVDELYVPILDIAVQAGRNFRNDLSDDQHNDLLVNESFVKKYEIVEPVEYILDDRFAGEAGSRIVGVVEDFHYLDLRQEIRPLILRRNKDAHFRHLLVKLVPGSLTENVTAIRRAWKEINPNLPFDFSFLDEDLQQQYQSETRWGKIVSISSLFALLIASLGLFGLMALILVERKKELSIRKILGASFTGVSWLVSRQLLTLILISGLIAIPLVWYGMNTWLESYAYRIIISPLTFLSVMIIILVLVGSMVFVNTWRAHSREPATVLRSE